MILSPQDRASLIDVLATKMVAELRAEMGGSFQDLFCMDLGTASKMTGLSKPTLRANLPVVELSDGKHGIKVSVLNAYLERKTLQPGQESKRGKSAA